MNEWKIVVSMIVFLFLFLVSIVYIRARTPIEVAPTTHWSKIETSLIPACQIHDRSSAQDVCLSSQDSQDCTSNPRVVVVGDVHGEFDGLREILFASNITKNKESQNCEWTDQGPYGTVLVQVGDIVDRGPGATEVALFILLLFIVHCCTLYVVYCILNIRLGNVCECCRALHQKAPRLFAWWVITKFGG